MLTADGELGAEVYSAATKEEQARIVFDIAKQQARMEPEFSGPSGTFPMIQDIFLLYPMLKPKGLDAEGREVFSCKNFEPATGLCTIYEIRPTMCRLYPANGKCPCEGCTVQSA